MTKKTIKSLVFLFFLLIVSPIFPLTDNDEVVLAMCGPEKSQIINIQLLWEKDLLSIEKLKLICVYHQKEETDYNEAREWVKIHQLSWVDFKVIEGDVSLSQLFAENVWTSQFKDIFDKTHGIIFTGGEDMLPAIYGEENELTTDASTPMRSIYEASFLFHLVGGFQNPHFQPFLSKRNSYPVLAICLGMQTLNVATGGTLVQDIPSEIYNLHTIQQILKQDPDKIHSSIYFRSLYPVYEKDLSPAFHAIKLMKQSLFTDEMSLSIHDHPMVLTSHHQGVDKLGKDLQIIATSLDGKIIEAVSHKKFKNVLGMQFHPEKDSLFSKQKYYLNKPGGEKNLNLGQFLGKNSPAMHFHRQLWQWFSIVLMDQTKNQN